MAIDVARQVGGQYSEDTVVAGERRHVVWKDGRAIDAYPRFDGDLSARHELQDFPAELLKVPPIEIAVTDDSQDGLSGSDTRSASTGPAARARVDDAGAAHKGSQRQTQLWVNHRPDEVGRSLGAVLPELADASIEWRSPLAEEGYAEYRDGAFLAALDLSDHAGALAEFWPQRGPVWDALALVEVDGERGVILVEAKSYPGELFGPGCRALPKSRTRIETALAGTQEALGLDVDPGNWSGRMYQTANRIAHWYWLREVVGIRTWLVHLLFTGDPHAPTTEAEWNEAMAVAYAELGIDAPIDGIRHVVIPAETG
jgi:hypothetical protein